MIQESDLAADHLRAQQDKAIFEQLLEERDVRRINEQLEAEEGNARMSYTLATIKTDVELPMTPPELANGDPDKDVLLDWFTRLEFKSWIDELLSDEEVAPVETIETHYDIVTEQAALDAWLDKLAAADVFAFDTETTSLDYMAAELVGLSLSVAAGEAAYIPVAHDYPGAPDQLPRDEVLEKLRPWLENPDRKKVGHHLKYDAHVLADSRALADYFEAVVADCGDAKIAANWVQVELLGQLNRAELSLADSPVSAAELGGLIRRILDNSISGKIAKQVFEAMWAGEGSAEDKEKAEHRNDNVFI